MKRSIATAFLLSSIATTGYAQAVDPAVYSSLEYRFIGPDGNRAIAVVGVPGDPSTMLVGAASGGMRRGLRQLAVSPSTRSVCQHAAQ